MRFVMSARSPSLASRPTCRPARRWAMPVLLAALVVVGACDGDDDDDATGPGSDAVSVIQDAANDFLTTYTAGPRNGDLDVRRAEVTYDGTNFVFTSTSAATLGTTEQALFVWGVDRGQGTARFGDLATGVHFDAVIVARADGTGQVVDLAAAPPAPTPLAAGSVVVTGNQLRITVPATLLPSKGFSLQRYTANFWPRVGTGNNSQIADFAPDNRNLQIRSTQ